MSDSKNKGITVKNISTDFLKGMEKIKKDNNFTNNREILEEMYNGYRGFKSEMKTKINELCLKMNIDSFELNEILDQVIFKHINKMLKGYGLHKEKNKKSARAEQELMEVLKEIVAKNESLPKNERKYLSPSMVKTFLIINHTKYKQKNIDVIRRVISSPEADFVREYHEKNNLTVKSNKRIIK